MEQPTWSTNFGVRSNVQKSLSHILIIINIILTAEISDYHMSHCHLISGVNIPEWICGEAYVFLWVDSDEAFTETSEEDNKAFAKVQIRCPQGINMCWYCVSIVH